MSTAEIVEKESTTIFSDTTTHHIVTNLGRDYLVPMNYGLPKGEKEPKCECECHNKSKLAEVLDWLSYKKNIHIKCLECRCFG